MKVYRDEDGELVPDSTSTGPSTPSCMSTSPRPSTTWARFSEPCAQGRLVKRETLLRLWKPYRYRDGSDGSFAAGWEYGTSGASKQWATVAATRSPCACLPRLARRRLLRVRLSHQRRRRGHRIEHADRQPEGRRVPLRSPAGRQLDVAVGVSGSSSDRLRAARSARPPRGSARRARGLRDRTRPGAIERAGRLLPREG